MRQTLFALVVLSTVAFAQNVLAISPAPEGVVPVPAAVASGVSAAALVPPGSSLALLFAGLVGLTAAGRRIEGTPRA